MTGDAIPAGYVLAGIALLCAAVLPRLLHRWPVSPAMVFVAVGLAASFVPGAPHLWRPPVSTLVEHLTELCVIVALMGVGLALDRPLSLRGWATTWRLLGIGMPLFIAAATISAGWVLGVAVATALLLAGAVAPTDPVLASDVRVGEPTDDPRSEDEVRFALTSEAGLNDGLAFPFVHAAILLTVGGLGRRWIAWELAGKIVIAVVIGWAMGQILGRVAFRAPTPALRFADSAEATVALSAVLVAYGVTEVAGGYGFLAVFCAALSIRGTERGHHYHRVLHDFIGQIERLLTLGLLMGIGYAVGDGLLIGLTPAAAGWAVGTVLILRPLTAWVSLRGSAAAPLEQRTIAFFGVRGIGTVYYIAYGLNHASFPDSALIWPTATVVVLASVVVHGVTASPVLRRLDRRFGRRSPDPA